MWAYCKRATHGDPEEIDWSMSDNVLPAWLLKESALIQKIPSGKSILEPIGWKFDLDKADTKNYPQFTDKVEHWVRIKREMKNRCELDGCSRALFGGADGKEYVPSGDMDKTVFENQKKFMFEVFDVRW